MLALKGFMGLLTVAWMYGGVLGIIGAWSIKDVTDPLARLTLFFMYAPIWATVAVFIIGPADTISRLVLNLEGPTDD